jgi:hypothetical protein
MRINFILDTKKPTKNFTEVYLMKLKLALTVAVSVFVLFVLAYSGYGIFISLRTKALPEVGKYTGEPGRQIAGKNYLFRDTSGNYIIFPAAPANNTGVIIYPASFVDEKAYVPVAFDLADKGYSVFIARMPFGLSMLNTENGLNFTGNYKNIKKWYIIGHSLGGVAASVFVKKHPDTVSGIIFWASMPLHSMKESRTKTLCIYGTRDGFFGVKSLEKAKKLLPADTVYYTIEGGNHSQFAWYPDMPGDMKAEISREEQQRQALSEVLKFMK